MTNTPTANNEPDPTPPSHQRLWLILLSRAGIGVGIALLIGIMGGAWWVWIFVHKQLAPLVEKNVGQILNRPIQLGKVEKFSLNGLRFGASVIPETLTNANKASVQNVDVTFNPASLLLTRTLHLNVNLIKPNIYIKQEEGGTWISTKINIPAQQGVIAIKLESIRIENANVVLVPLPHLQPKKTLKTDTEIKKLETPAQSSQNLPSLSTPEINDSNQISEQKSIEISNLNGISRFLDRNQRITFQVVGEPKNGGKLKIVGEYLPSMQKTKLAIETENFLANNVTQLIKLPIDLQTGNIDSKLSLEFLGTEFQGSSLLGTANIQNVTVKVPALPQLLTKTIGKLNFKGYEISLENIKTFYGKVSAQATGKINTQLGYNIAAQTVPVGLKDVVETLDLNLPFSFQNSPVTVLQPTPKNTPQIPSSNSPTPSSLFPIPNSTPTPSSLFPLPKSPNPGALFPLANTKPQTPTTPIKLIGEIKADIKITGAIEKPVISGNIINTKATQIDRLNLQTISGNFQLAESTLTIKNAKAIPSVGGQLNGSGVLKLAPTGSAAFDIWSNNLPGDELAKVMLPGYAAEIKNTKTPIRIGNLTTKGQISGPWNNLQTVLKWNALQSTYPSNGELVITPTGKINLRNTNIAIAGGIVKGGGEINNGLWQAALTVAGVQPKLLSSQLASQFKFPLFGKFNLSGSLDSFKPENIRVSGSGSIKIGGGTLRSDNFKFQQGKWQAALNADGVELGKVAEVSLPLRSGIFFGKFNLSGSLISFQPETISGSGNGNLNLAGTNVKIDGLKLSAGKWQTSLQTNNLLLGKLPNVPLQFQKSVFSGKFNLEGSLANFQPQTINGIGEGNLNLAGGNVKIDSLQLSAGKWQTALQANNVQLQNLPNIPLSLREGNLSGKFTLAGSLTDFTPQSIHGIGEGRINIDGDIINANNLQFGNGLWRTVIQTQGVYIQNFTQVPSQLKGRLSGLLNLSGSLTAFKPENINAIGNANLKLVSDGTISAQNIQLAKGLWQANLQVSGVNLKPLAQLSNPNLKSLVGNLDFIGKVAGNTQNIKAVNIVGAIPRLSNLGLNNWQFEPSLSGKVQLLAGKDSFLQLNGIKDQIQLALSPTLQPISFLIQNQDTKISGKTEGKELLVIAQNLPLKILQDFAVNTPLAKQSINGKLSGNLAVNLNNFDIVGNNIAIVKPILGKINGDLFTGNFTYNSGIATLTKGEFRQGESLYFLTGSFKPTPQGPEFFGTAKISQGKIEDMLTAMQIFEIQDLKRGFSSANYGKAKDIQPIMSVGEANSKGSLQHQLQRFSEITALLQQNKQQRREESPLPELQDFKGVFSGEITAQASPKQGIKANFNLSGNNWLWGINKPGERVYKASEVIAKGSFQNGILTVDRSQIKSGETLLTFSGNVGGKEQTGQLRAQNIPAEIVQDFVDLPIDIFGKINAKATLAGSIENPQSIGELTLNQGTLNGAQVNKAQISFQYANANLNFSSELVVNNSQQSQKQSPIIVNGSIPYKLPFANIKPESNKININVDVKNEGMALLNLLTRKQIAWLQGEGEVKLQINGTIAPDNSQIQELVAEGTAIVNNATIKSQILPENLTGIRGKILFDFDKIHVEGLNPEESFQGKYSGGLIQAKGSIPISIPANTESPLKINIGELALNLKELYIGGVKGNLVITGTALAPKIGGRIKLFDGEILLADTTPQLNNENESAIGITEFNQLQLNLGKGVQINKSPILNFLATGGLQLNGTLDNIRPEGTITLQRGQVNLFTTQFRLDGAYKQTAKFIPSQGLDPNLDIRLLTAVPEVTRNRLPLATLSSEISDTNDLVATNLGALQTLRIQARILGRSSQLSDNLELTSNPSRTKTEIVALLGGGFVNTLGQGDSSLELANLAGSAVLGNIQNVIGNALGLTDFRLFPTIINSNSSKGQTSTLGLGGEIGFDITSKFSTSLLKILTTDQPTQFTLRYRLNEQLLLRGSTDLSGDNKLQVEYEKRF